MMGVMAELPFTDERTTRFDAPPSMVIDPAKRYTAVMDTSMGSMTIELDAEHAPITVNNFVFLATNRYYEGIIFHRVIQGFVAQGGDPEGSGRGGPGYKFQDEEVKKPYELGSLAMANAGPNTNGSQFFLISGPSGVRLPPQYNHFGKVVEGLDVVDAIEKLATGAGDRPKEDVVINKVTITES
jgi:cyclophilin family peptidyl-prolyl cis-trans isomerase